MLKLRPENRLTWKEYFNHKFFNMDNKIINNNNDNCLIGYIEENMIK